MKPGAQHQYLAQLEGSWTVTGKMWIDPSSPPVEISGTSENKMIFDGRFLQQAVKGKMMGQDLVGFGLIGYDNLAKAVQSIWIDNMGTMILMMTGTFAKDGKQIIAYGEFKDIKRGSMQKYKTVHKLLSKDEMVYEMFYMLPDGKEAKTMTLLYKKK
jgi:hypothetical protein